MQIITLEDARAKGLRHYFTGKPCVRGHVAPRFTSIRKCKECAREDAMKVHVFKTDRRKSVVDTASFIKACTEVHGDTYDYSKVVWTAAKCKVVIVCKIHGKFAQTADNHKVGHGCPACRAAATSERCLTTKARFIEKVLVVHGDVLDFSKTVYRGSHTAIRVVCKEHNTEFLQAPTSMLSGHMGCTKCNHMKSAPEDEVATYLSLFTEVQSRDRKLIAPYELDIVLPEHKLAVEYCGEYYHSSGDQESEVKMATKHIRKHQAAADAGYRLITLYGSEWETRKPVIKRLLRNAIGKGRGRLMARKCELKTVTNADATVFYDKYHPQGGAGHGEHYGLYWNDKLVACMRFTHGSNDRGNNKTRVWTLSRYATRVTVAGGASRLLKAFVTDKSPKQVKSFSDNRFFGGGMYETLGFELKEESSADYMVWHHRLGLRHKSHWQRREIQDRARQLGAEIDFNHETDPRTERDMTYLLGARRIYDCGKKTWVLNT